MGNDILIEHLGYRGKFDAEEMTVLDTGGSLGYVEGHSMFEECKIIQQLEPRVSV